MLQQEGKQRMSFHDIVVDASPREDISRTLELARDMASAYAARLFVVAYAWPVTTVSDVLGGGRFGSQALTRELQQAIASSRSAFDRVFSAATVDTEWCSGIGDPATVLVDHLLTADLLITGVSAGNGNVVAEPAALALNSGAPVLRLGEREATDRFSRVVVGWKDCPQARRALHAALPILVRADEVVIVGVGDEVKATRLETVVDHLQRHGVTASYAHLPQSEEGVSADLVCHALRKEADLVVTGAYGRGPLAERVLGGVTRDLLKTADLHWFMAS